MKKFLFVIFIIMCMFAITGCDSKTTEKISQNTVKAMLNDDGNIVISEEEITEEATFINYEVDEITIGLIAVRGTDGIVRVAFNTCQSCSPSPNAYFIQEGEYFVCQNCETKFHVDDIGKKKGGCNPAPVEEMTSEDGVITISKEYVESYKEKFENWNGPKA